METVFCVCQRQYSFDGSINKICNVFFNRFGDGVDRNEFGSFMDFNSN